MGDASLKRTLPSQLNTSTKFLIQLAPLWGRFGMTGDRSQTGSDQLQTDLRLL